MATPRQRIGRTPADYLKPGIDRPRRVLNIDLCDERYEPVFQYAAQTNPDGTVQDAIRELLLLATSAVASDAAIFAARQQAYREARMRIHALIGRTLREAVTELELETPNAEQTSIPAGNFIAA